MDSRQILEQRVQTLKALKHGGIRLGFGNNGQINQLQQVLQTQWEIQRNLLQRVLREEGDPEERLLEWRERTTNFMKKYPTREGWKDRTGQEWKVKGVVEAIDNLLEEIENTLMGDEDFGEYEDEQEDNDVER